MKRSVKIRSIIFKILLEIQKKNLNFDNSYNNFTKDLEISELERSMIYNVCLNSMRYKFYTNKILLKYLRKKSKINEFTLFLSAITQIVYLDFKEYAVVNDSVEIAKLSNIYPGLVNAVLKKISINKNKLIKTKILFKNLPEWFVSHSKQLKKIDKNKFLKNFYKQPNLHIVFKNKVLLKNFNDKIINTTDFSGFILRQKKIEEISKFKNGQWWVQDFSSMLPIHLSPEIKNKKIIDICAAPGGKSFQAISNGGIVDLNDINKEKIIILKRNLRRLNYNNLVINKNALDIRSEKKYDVVIVDAPCSAIGTIRRNPEIFFKKIEPDMKGLNKLQRQLLDKASQLLNKKGIIIYIVCSFLYYETERQKNYFLKKNKNFSSLKFKSKYDEKYKSFIKKSGEIFSLPSKYNGYMVDGFYAAKFIKND